MKKNLTSILSLIFAGAALVISLHAWSLARDARDYSDDLLAELSRNNQALQAQIDALTGQQETEDLSAGLVDWSLEASLWADGTGADVTLTALPGTVGANTRAILLVTLDGQEIAQVECSLNGGIFSGTAPLPAADGYSYTLRLSRSDETWQTFPLASPENPQADIPVYLASSLRTYCNLFVAQWQQEEDNLILTAYAQAQLPRIAPSGTPGIADARLVLKQNGEEVHSMNISLIPGEGSGGYEAALEAITLPLPQLEADDELQLWLEVTLTDGQTLAANGICWYLNGDTLYALVG